MIGDAITRLRKEKNIKQKDFAEQIGGDVAYLCQVENNKRTTTLEYLKKISKELNVSFAELLFEGLDKEDRESYIGNFRENEYWINKMVNNLK